MYKTKNLVICESPSKSKTIEKILGPDYKVKASFGHIMDLPKSKLGFDPKNNFKPEYSVTKDKLKVVKELKSLIGPDTVIWLAADDDREGERIAYDVGLVLGKNGNITKRVKFHEITKNAILEAMNNPTKVNMDTVWAQTCRRIIDRAVGYKLSPLLWKKIKYGLSAGRVVSVTVRIVVDREKEISDFKPDEYWKLLLSIKSKPPFKAELLKIDGKNTKVKNETEASSIKTDCDKHDYILDDIVSKDSTRNPPPPFITSSLQQTASTQLGFAPKKTMMLAQKLYEGSIRVSGHTGGLITYMRTDSVNLSDLATTAAKNVIRKEYGDEYTLPYVRKYKTKAKGAQEAHEGIRPTVMELTPSSIKRHLSHDEYRLYALIWKRAMATQMAPAKVATTTYKILGGKDRNYEFVSKGTKILFPGFMMVYTEGSDNVDDALSSSEKFLPDVEKGTVFKDTLLDAEQHFTKPPARYTEASLIKKLETEGIGRPSTYATTISTIMNREYVEKTKEKTLAPTVIGTVVTDYLIEHFPDIVSLSFTANMENDLDKISEGKMKWYEVMHNFYDDFVKAVESKDDSERVNYSEAKLIGVDPASKLDVFIRVGQHGNYVQLGEKEEGSKNKPKTSPIPKGRRLEEVDLEEALRYLELPKILGTTPEGDDIKVAIGMFGPYLQVKKTYYSLKEDDPYTITLERAREIIKELNAIKAKALWVDFPEANTKIIDGRYGPYITVGEGKSKKNYKLPRGMKESDVRKLTLADIDKIIKSQPTTPKKKFKRR